MAEIPSWQRQSYAKNGSTSGPSKMNGKIAGNSTSFHGKIAKPTVQNYADGGEVVNENPFQGDDVDPFSAVRDAETGSTAPKQMADDTYNEDVKQGDKPVAKAQSFKEAFAENRKAGNSTFEWNGKKFSTEVATGKAAPRMEAKRAEPSASVPATGGGKSIMFKDKPAPAAPKSTSFDPDAINFGDTKVEPKPAARTFRQTRGGRIYDDELPAKEEAKPRVHPRTGRPL